jgi:hypothetical protein
MNISELDFSSNFLLSAVGGPKVKITDLTDYASNGITTSKVAGLIKGQRGSSIFYNNTNYDSPDISRGSTDNDSVDLPVDSQGLVPKASYLLTYSIRVLDEIFNSKAGTMPANAAFLFTSATNYTAAIETLLTQATAVKLYLYNSSAVKIGEVDVLTASYNGGLTIQTIGTSAFASFANVASARIVTFYEKESTYDYCVKFPDVKLAATPDCYRSQMTIRDNTQFSSEYSVLSRLITVQFPRDSSGNPVETTITSSAASLTIGPNIWTGGYEISLEMVVVHTGTDGLITTKTLVGYIYPNVECDPGLCCISDCLTSLHNKYQEALMKGSSQTATYREILFNTTIYICRFQIYLNCQNTEMCSEVASELISYLRQNGCNCDCSPCGVDGEPTEIQPFGV